MKIEYKVTDGTVLGTAEDTESPAVGAEVWVNGGKYEVLEKAYVLTPGKAGTAHQGVMIMLRKNDRR